MSRRRAQLARSRLARRVALWLSAAALACFGCEPLTAPPADGGSDGGAAVEPPAACPAGTMLFPGEVVCAPGDWAGCAAGFVAAAGGWGCEPVLPAAACTGATREALGETACRPVGDCAAAPPADAALFVDASRTAPDTATQFRTVSAAVAAAASGAKIFIRPGQYAESLTLTRPVTLAGQCPRDVHLVGPGGVVASTIRVNTPGVVLEGLTLRSGYAGLSIAGGASVVARQLIVDGAGAVGVSLAEAGSSLSLSDAVIRNATPVSSGSGWGLSVQNGSTAVLAEVALAGNHVTGLRASGAGSTIRATSVVVRDTNAGGTYDWGRGAVSQRGARLEVTRGAFLGSVETGVVVAEAAQASLTDVVISGTRPSGLGKLGRGINLADGSRLTLVRGTVSHNRDAAVMVAGAGAFADVRDSVVFSTTPSGDPIARGITVQEGGGLALSGSAVVASVEAGIAVVDEGSWAALGRCAILETALDLQGKFGHGLVMGLSTVAMRGCQVGRSAGIGLAIGPGSFVGDELAITANGTGLFADAAVKVTVSDVVPQSAGPDEAILSTSSRFIGNRTTNGAGLLALPGGLSR